LLNSAQFPGPDRSVFPGFDSGRVPLRKARAADCRIGSGRELRMVFESLMKETAGYAAVRFSARRLQEHVTPLAGSSATGVSTMENQPINRDPKSHDDSESFTRSTHVVYRSAAMFGGRTDEEMTEETVEESLVVDDRSALSPAQLVEDRLTRMLRDASVPVSHTRARSLLRGR